MLFNSIPFLFFFAAVFILNHLLRRRQTPRFVMLLAASCIFYAVWNTWLLALLLLIVLIDFSVAIGLEAISNQKHKLALLCISLTVNLGILAVFKYFNFFSDSAATFFNMIGLPFQKTTLNLFLPVGISFHTFQSMGYTVDVYRGDIKAERSLLRFALFVTFFPQLVAGPIVRPKDFLPQLDNEYHLTKTAFITGTTLIWLGLFKKIMLADFFALHSDAYFSHIAAPHNIADFLLAAYSFTFQIYFDFSGYTDTAIGCALLLGYKFPLNFFHPYNSTSLSEFWARWHISLSSWFRDYVYIPLGGNRKKRNRNVFITMLLSGFWHGAAWHFVFWGAYHGALLTLENLIKGRRKNTAPAAPYKPPPTLPDYLVDPPKIPPRSSTPHPRWLFNKLVIFHIAVAGWILFRINSMHDLRYIPRHIANLHITGITAGQALAAALVISIFILETRADTFTVKKWLSSRPFALQTLAHACILATIIILGSFNTPFIYFQF